MKSYLSQIMGEIKGFTDGELRIKIIQNSFQKEFSWNSNPTGLVTVTDAIAMSGKYKGNKQYVVEIMPINMMGVPVPYVVYPRDRQYLSSMEGYKLMMHFSGNSIWRCYPKMVRYLYHVVTQDTFNAKQSADMYSDIESLYIQRMKMDNYTYPALTQEKRNQIEHEILRAEKLKNHAERFLENKNEAQIAANQLKKQIQKVLKTLTDV